jgi:hypothetical protein
MSDYDNARLVAGERYRLSDNGPGAMRQAMDRAAEAGAVLASSAYARLAKYRDGATRHVGTVGGAATQAWSTLSLRLGEIHAAARTGLRDGILRDVRESRVPQGPTNPLHVQGAMARAEAYAAFARTVLGPESGERGQIILSDEVAKVRRFVARTSSEALSAIRGAASETCAKASRMQKYAVERANVAYLGTSEAFRAAAQDRHMRIAAYMAAAGGLVAMGLVNGAINVPDVHAAMASLGGAVDGAAHSAHFALAEAGRYATTAGQHAASFGEHFDKATNVDSLREFGQRIVQAGSEWWSKAGSALGGSLPGHEIVRTAGLSHVQHMSDAFSQATHTSHHAVAGASHLHHGHVPHHAHTAGHVPSSSTEALNADELARIRKATEHLVRTLPGLPNVDVTAVCRVDASAGLAPAPYCR